MWETRLREKRIVESFIQTNKGIKSVSNFYSATMNGNVPWKKTRSGVFRFVVKGSAISFSVVAYGVVAINWGDGGVSTSRTGKISHNYTRTGTYTVTVTGDVSVWDFGSSDSLNEVLTPFPVGIKTCNGCFKKCTNLRKIPANLFENCIHVTNFSYCFYFCHSLSAIPPGLFDNCANAVNFTCCFSVCRSISTIPAGLFDYCIKATSFYDCFNQVGISVVPEKLFANCTEAVSFGSCFYNVKLNSIPERLFWNCPNVTDFSSCFVESKISSIPSGLFRYNTKVESFRGCFSAYDAWSSNLTSVSEDLFASCALVTDFAYCFIFCDLRAIPAGLFKNCANIRTIDSCFERCFYVRGEAPRIWERFPNAYASRCFYDCTGLSNYNEIPLVWK